MDTPFGPRDSSQVMMPPKIPRRSPDLYGNRHSDPKLPEVLSPKEIGAHQGFHLGTRAQQLKQNAVQLDELERVLDEMFGNMRSRLLVEFQAALVKRLAQAEVLGADANTLRIWQYEGQAKPSKLQKEVQQCDKTVASIAPQSQGGLDEVAQLFQIMDGDGDGELQKAEFVRAFNVNRDVVAFCRQHHRLTPLLNPRTFRDAFDHIDTDHSNTISLAEFRVALDNYHRSTGAREELRDATDYCHHSIESGDCEDDSVAKLYQMINMKGSEEVSKYEFVRALKTNEAVIAFCRQNSDLAPLLNSVTFRHAFTQVKGFDTKHITLKQLREALEIMISRRTASDGETPIPIGRADDHDFGNLGLAVLRESHSSHLDREVYDVATLYWDTGIAQAMARSPMFLNITLGIVMINAVYLGIDAEHNKAELILEAHWPFIICEYLFCLFFLSELGVRFAAFKRKSDCLTDNWFKFDFLLVFLMMMETVVLPFILPLVASSAIPPPTGPLRLLRLLRLSRLVRLMRSFPELIVIIKAMATAFRAVTSSLLMIAILIYCFSIVLHMLLEGETGEVADYFETLPRCMWTLLTRGALLDDISEVLGLLVFRADFRIVAAVLVFMVFIFLAALTVMNLVIGILCQVVSQIAWNEKEEADITLMRQTILLELKRFDDGDGMITEDEVMELMADPRAVAVLDSLDVDLPFLQRYQLWTFEETGKQMPMKAVIDQMLACRRELPVTVKHMVMLQNLNNWALYNNIVANEERMGTAIASQIIAQLGEFIANVPKCTL